MRRADELVNDNCVASPIKETGKRGGGMKLGNMWNIVSHYDSCFLANVCSIFEEIFHLLSSCFFFFFSWFESWCDLKDPLVGKSATRVFSLRVCVRVKRESNRRLPWRFASHGLCVSERFSSNNTGSTNRMIQRKSSQTPGGEGDEVTAWMEIVIHETTPRIIQSSWIFLFFFSFFFSFLILILILFLFFWNFVRPCGMYNCCRCP